MDDELYVRLKSKLEIDPLQLDYELIALPMLIMEVAEYCASQVDLRDRCEFGLKNELAEAADELRSSPIADGKGGAKVRSETQITSEVLLSDKVREAQKRLEEAKFDLALAQGLSDSFRAKRDSLKVYADLIIAGYVSPNSSISKRNSELRESTTAAMQRRKLRNTQENN